MSLLFTSANRQTSWEMREDVETAIGQASRSHTWPRSRVMTRRKLDALIESGRGLGSGESYQPWIRVRRNLSSPVSNLYVLCTPLYASRGLHLLSGIERNAALVLLWLGASEIREQFPMWPHPHVAPLPWISSDHPQTLVRGLSKTAEAAGIKHGVYPGTDIPYVGTIDLFAVLGAGMNRRAFAVSCKPKHKMQGARAKRVNERLELERLYSGEIGAEWVLFHDESISTTLGANLDWFMPLRSELLALRGKAQFEDFAGHFESRSANASISLARASAAEAVGLTDLDEVHKYFRTAVWLGHINLDLSCQVNMSKAPVRDSRNFKTRLLEQLLQDRVKCR